jgi:segregation and condensation protein B
MDEKEAERIIEAALFMSSRPIEIKEFAKILGIAATGFVYNLVENLQKRYSQAESSIEIVNEEGKYYMRVKPQYLAYVKDFAQQAEISKHALKTLAFISKNEGIKKSILAKKLGSQIYSDVAELEQKGFIEQKKQGRTTAIFTTEKFKTYFGVN